MPATTLMTQTLPTVIGMGVVSEATRRMFRKKEGMKHYHFRGKRIMSHSHGGGHIAHYHKGLRGYGRTRQSARR